MLWHRRAFAVNNTLLPFLQEHFAVSYFGLDNAGSADSSSAAAAKADSPQCKERIGFSLMFLSMRFTVDKLDRGRTRPQR